MQSRQTAIRGKLRELLAEHFAAAQREFDPQHDAIALSIPTYDGADVAEALDSILDGWPTMGPKVQRVEERMAEFMGVRNAVMTSSGGAANLLALYLAASPYMDAERRLSPGDEIVTPAVTWSTTVSPIIQVGCTPVLADVNLGTYDIRPEAIEPLIGERTRALMIVHALGHPCNMDAIARLCQRHRLLLIEDTCESLAARHGSRYVGSFGDLATLSFYFSHHITSIEGGMILTDHDGWADTLRSMRANGWLRDIRSEATRNAHAEAYPQIDPAFLFPHIGFNLKPTDVAAGLLLHQIERLPGFVARRTAVAEALRAALQRYQAYLHLPYQAEGSTHSWFNFALVVREDAPFARRQLTSHLNEYRVATRPVIAGNIAAQPFMRQFAHRSGELPNSELVMRNGFFIGCHHGLGDAQVRYMVEAFDSFFRSRGLAQHNLQPGPR